MTGRPEILFPFFADITRLPGIGPKIAKSLENIEIFNPKDLLLTLPSGVIDRRLRQSISGLVLPAVATVEVEVGRHQPGTSTTRPYRIFVRDVETEFQLVFFHARPDWLKRQLPSGTRRVVSGRLELFDGIAQMTHPDHILTRDQAGGLPEHEPHYPLTAGVTQKAMAKAIRGALDKLVELPEWIDPGVVQDKGWPAWREAIEVCQTPRGNADLDPNAPERQRLAYDEFLAHQTTLAMARANRRAKPGVASGGDGRLITAVRAALPFAPTSAQDRAAGEIMQDMSSSQRMNRLLQGDVGSGKTLVALFSALNAIEAGGQAALMAPTEILARQHLAGLSDLAAPAGIQIDLLTGRTKGGERARILKDLAEGRTGLLIGTHALFQRDVAFRDLRLAIIDEQHRFGVRQRMDLGAKGDAVDILVMTATPIPRSLELAHYGGHGVVRA